MGSRERQHLPPPMQQNRMHLCHLSIYWLGHCYRKLVKSIVVVYALEPHEYGVLQTKL